MKPPSALKKLAVIVGVFVILWLGLGVFVYTSPLVVLHYAADAAKPVVYFFNEDDDVTKKYIDPGERIEFRTPHHPPADYYINVSLPFASRDGVDIKQPFSRVDVYIGADTKITQIVTRTDYLARFSSK